MMRAFVLAVAALVAAACAAPAQVEPAKGPGIDGRPLVTASGDIDNSVQEALNADKAACEKAGGDLRPVCRMGKPMCVVTFSDAGKQCSDSSECMGRCMAENGAEAMKPAVGHCAADNQPCGCMQIVANGLAQPTLCVD